MADSLRRRDAPSTTAATPSTLMTMTGTATSGMPSSSDSYSDGNSSSNDMQSTSLVNYYFVFLALIICVAGLSGFFLWRRRTRAQAAARMSQQHALARDLGNGNSPSRMADGRFRGYWHGRWRSQENVGREEGLNELGEAPPAYAPPKTREEQEREAAAAAEAAEGPAVPMQTLSREDAGLKPPDYSEMTVRAVESPARRSDGSGEGSSSAAERESETR